MMLTTVEEKGKNLRISALILSIYPIIKISYKVNKGNWPVVINTADIQVLRPAVRCRLHLRQDRTPGKTGRAGEFRAENYRFLTNERGELILK